MKVVKSRLAFHYVDVNRENLEGSTNNLGVEIMNEERLNVS